jgi:hypothetical protein
MIAVELTEPVSFHHGRLEHVKPPDHLMPIKSLALFKGAATFVPGVMNLACGGSGGTDSPRYCYSVWLRHLARLAEAGLGTHFETVAELGPGDSVGIGLSAMLTGANRYFAFDALPHARKETNLQTLERLVELFSRQEPVPGVDEFPEIWPSIVSLDFPRATLGGGRLDVAMRPQRLAAIRRALEFGDGARWRSGTPLHGPIPRFFVPKTSTSSFLRPSWSTSRTSP